MLIHVVKPGETLWQISAYYGVPMSKIISINRLPNPNQLLVGQSILIPIEATSHQVRPGETLWQIAQRYGVTAESLMQANNITNPFVITPGTTLVIPQRPKPVINVNAYVYAFGEKAVPQVLEVGDYLTYVSPFSYRIKEDGSLVPIDDAPAILAAYEKKALPLMAINNFTVGSLGQNVAHTVLNDAEIRNTLITNILNTLKEKGYQGTSIDFENVLPEDREAYNQFLQLCVDRLHPEGYLVSTALAPKTSAGQIGLLYEAHDYAAHGRIVDFVLLMTYEWGYRLGPPQPISPFNEILRVLNYAVSVIPREKIYFGFEIYARDWTLPHVKGQESQTFSPQEAIIRAARYGVEIQFDPIAQSPFYIYTDEKGVMHEVWFEDARSAQIKFDAVKAYNLGGIGYWVLGYPFPQNWALLDYNFTIKKFL